MAVLRAVSGDARRRRTSLTGWGNACAAATTGTVVTVDRHGLAAVVAASAARGTLARGLGRSYGDAAQNGGGTLVRLRELAPAVAVDDRAGLATVGGGVSIDDLLRVIVPRGFFVPVTPGTRSVTIGGAVASDIHGKNHHVDGSLGSHVVRMSLMLADGSVVELSPGSDAELFWCTVGGMGLTGIVVDVTLRLIRIETSRCTVDTVRCADLDDVMAAMEDGDHRYRYSVAWVDGTATGASLGRSVLTRGDHATLDRIGAHALTDPLDYDPRQRVTVPPAAPPSGVLNRATVAAFNELWYRRAPRRRDGEIASITSFFHPLDAIGSWNRLYGRRGFVQYQILAPFGQEPVLRRVVERLASSGAPSFLTVLKRFGAANPAPLSFPAPGWALSLDLPVGRRGLGTLLHDLDREVLDAGGRHYLAKDGHTTPDMIRRGYPRLDEWRAVRDRADPNGVWRSDLARRLDLVGSMSRAARSML